MKDERETQIEVGKLLVKALKIVVKDTKLPKNYRQDLLMQLSEMLMGLKV